MAESKSTKGKSSTDENGKRLTVVANRGPRLQVKINGDPKDTAAEALKKIRR
jgi:hypothetical protein